MLVGAAVFQREDQNGDRDADPFRTTVGQVRLPCAMAPCLLNRGLYSLQYELASTLQAYLTFLGLGVILWGGWGASLLLGGA